MKRPGATRKIRISHKLGMRGIFGGCLLLFIAVGVALFSVILPARIDSELGQQFRSELLPAVRASLQGIDDDVRKRLTRRQAEIRERIEQAYVREKRNFTKGLVATLLPLVENLDMESVDTEVQRKVDTVDTLVGARVRTQEGGQLSEFGTLDQPHTRSFREIAKTTFAFVEVELQFSTEVLEKSLRQDALSLESLLAGIKDSSATTIDALTQNIVNVQADTFSSLRSMILISAPIAALLLVASVMLLLEWVVARPVGGEPREISLLAQKIAAGDLSNVFKAKATGIYAAMRTMQQELKTRLESDRRASAETDRIRVALDNVSGNVMVADAEGKMIYMNKAVVMMFCEAEEQLCGVLPNFNVGSLHSTNLHQLYEDLSHQRLPFSELSSQQSAEFEVGGRTFRIVANPVFNERGERLGTAVEWTDRTVEVTVEHEVQSIVDYALAGKLNQRIDQEDKTGFFLKLSQGLNALLDVSERVINDTLRMLGAMSNGNLTESINVDYEGTFGQLKRNANTTVATLTEVIAKIKKSADSVTNSSEEISQGNTDLSQRTGEQASALEEMASSMERITSSVRQNADNAHQADQLALGAREQAEKGGDVVGDAVSAMGEINAASKKIADIIGIIDEIAFQTNLLALNAAVEAARAGEQGRGFAVVASEVRNLAQRSATAAKEIKSLIKDSVEKVEQGSHLVDQSGKTLAEIVISVKRVSDIVAEIAAASSEQSSGIEQVNKAIMQMDEKTQQNAALVEQVAAASESMDEQALGMKALVDFFRVSERIVERPESREHDANNSENWQSTGTDQPKSERKAAAYA